jgi:hypothetical protein
LFNWAIGEDIISVSPVACLKESPETSRDRVLDDFELDRRPTHRSLAIRR